MNAIPTRDGLVLFVTVHTLPGMSAVTLAAVAAGLSRAADRVTHTGRLVRYVRGVYTPERGRWICLFAAADESAVRDTIALAQLPRTDVEPAVEPVLPS